MSFLLRQIDLSPITQYNFLQAFATVYIFLRISDPFALYPPTALPRYTNISYCFSFFPSSLIHKSLFYCPTQTRASFQTYFQSMSAKGFRPLPQPFLKVYPTVGHYSLNVRYYPLCTAACGEYHSYSCSC